jgi:hypothetical protein
MGSKVASSSNINTRLYPLASIYVIVNNIIINIIIVISKDMQWATDDNS